MGGLYVFHLNGIRTTHSLGYVDRLFVFLQHMVPSKWEPLKTLVFMLLIFLSAVLDTVPTVSHESLQITD